MSERDDLLDDAARRALAYLSGLEDRRVGVAEEDLQGLAAFDEPLPEGPGDAAATLALLDESGSPATVATAGPRYFGFVNGATLPAALAASWLATAWDQNHALAVMSPVASRIHTVTVRWLIDLLGLPDGTEAAFVTGATVANATALAAARDRQLERAGWDAVADGLFEAPPITVVVGEHSHSTVFKALGMLGLGRRRVVTVPADTQGRLRAGALPRRTEGPAIVCCQAGDVNTGCFDPFPEIVDWARARDAWVHVDAAFGLWAAASPRLTSLVEGMADADSWATDGHKWLNVPYDSGAALVRDGADLRRSFALVAGYLPSSDEHDAMHHTPQSSQRARVIEWWAALRSLGRTGVAALVDRCCDHAARFADRLAAGGLEVLNEVVLNQVLVRAGDDATTVAMVERVQDDGTCWCGPTTWDGRPAMRISVSGWSTTAEDVDRSAEAILAAARGGR